MKNAVAMIVVNLLLFSLCSCKKEIHNTKDFNELINDPANGYQISHSVNGVKVTVIYTPPEYVALKKAEATQGSYDSLLQDAKQSAFFIMVFAPDESKGNTNDIMYDGLRNFKEYAERSLTLNFDLEHAVELNADKRTYAPVLSSLENTYGLTKDRKVNLAFAPITDKNELAQATDFDLVYTDETFGTGVLHFYFDKKKIAQRLPKVSIR